MLSRVLTLAAFASALSLAAPVSAAVHYAVYQGTVIAGVDPAGDFGSVGALSGAFTAVLQFDPTGGLHQQGPYSETVFGGPGSAYPDPVSAATLYIGTHAVAFPTGAGTYGSVGVDNLFGVPGGDYSDVSAYSQTLLPTLNATLHMVAYTLDAPNRFVPYSGLQAAYLDPPSTAYWADIVGGQDQVRFSASLSVDSVFVTDDPTAYLPSPAPEPASWAMAIVGLLGCGAALRRRQVISSGPGAAFVGAAGSR